MLYSSSNKEHHIILKKDDMLTLNPQYNLTLKAVNHKDGVYVIENCISISGV